MFKDKRNLDAELEKLEGDTAGRLLHFAGEHVKPRPEFALQLEERLRRNAASPRPYSPTEGASDAATYPVAYSGTATPRRGGLRLVWGGLGLAAVVAVVLGLLFVLGGYGPQTRASQLLREYLPPGKVRYIMAEQNKYWPASGLSAGGRSLEVWMVSGKSHPLMRVAVPGYTIGSMSLEEMYSFAGMSVEEDAVYQYSRYHNTYYKYPYDPRFLEPYLPKDMGELLKMPNARVVGKETLNGQQLTVIESIADRPDPMPDPNAPETSVTDVRIWYDEATSLVMKREATTTYLSGPRSGGQVVETFRVYQSELKERTHSDYPDGFFRVSIRDAKVVEVAQSPFEATPTSFAAQPTAQRGVSNPALGSSVVVTRWDEKAQHVEIRPVDPATGQTSTGYAPIVVGGKYIGPQTLSSDGAKLATVGSHGQSPYPSAGGTSYPGSADVLYLIDVEAWRVVTAALTVQSDKDSNRGWAGLLSFSPDNARLALTYHAWQTGNRFADVLLLVDADTGKMIVEKEIGFKPSLLEFSPDGSQLVVYGQPWGADPGMTKPDPPRVLLLDVSTLEVEWEYTFEDVVSGYWCEANCQADHSQQLHASWRPAVVPSHDGSKLYIVHADHEEKLTMVDFEARKVSIVEIREAQPWFEQLLDLTASTAEAKAPRNGVEKDAVLSPDGRRLYVVGRKMKAERGFVDEPLKLQVINVESGQRIASAESAAFNVSISPDESHLYLSGNYNEGPGRWKQRTEMLDAESLQELAQIEEWEVIPTRRLDGTPIILGYSVNLSGAGKTQFAVLDPRTLQPTASWSVEGYAQWVIRP